MRYSVILSDPPWSYDNSAVQGAALNQYPTMTDGEVRDLPVADLAADDCILLLWATWPKLDLALDVVESWGFRYLTAFPWIKVTSVSTDLFTGEIRLDVPYGVGFWARGTSEPILIARRGQVSPPSNGFVGLLSPNLHHSRKPDSIYDFAEALPGPRLEMFARRQRAGWSVFGNETPGSIDIYAPRGVA